MTGLWLGVGLAVAAPTRGLTEVQPAAPAGPTAYRRQVALVVGIGDYEDPDLDLAYAVEDARAVARRLRERFGYDEVIELYDEAATRAGVLSELTKLAALHPDDALFIFWAGHGITNRTASGESIGYLVPWDGTADREAAAVHDISMHDMRSLVGLQVPARHRFLVVDACYSGILATRSPGRIPDADANWLVRNHSRDTFQVLTAGQADETVLDIGPGGHSVFTARLLEVLDETDGYTTASEVAVELQRAVRADAWVRGGHAQTPAFGRVAGTGEFVLAPVDRGLPTLAVGPRRSRTLAWASAGSLVLGAAGLGTAALTRSHYQSSPLTAGPQDGLVRLNVVSGVAGYTGLAASGALFTAALWVGEW